MLREWQVLGSHGSQWLSSLLFWSCLCLSGRPSTPAHLCYLFPSRGLSNWGFRLPMRGSGYVRIARAKLHVCRCTLGRFGRSIEHILTSGSACWFLVPTRFLWSSRHRARCVLGVGSGGLLHN